MNRSTLLMKIALSAALLVCIAPCFAGSAAAQVDQAAVAHGYTCVLESGSVRCKGVAPGITAYGHNFNPVPGLSGAASGFGAGRYHACAVLGGAVKCWGSNGYGQLGVGEYQPKSAPTQVVGLTSGATKIALSDQESCAIVSGGAKCWGRGTSGQLGTGSPLSDTGLPVDVAGLASGVTDISAGVNHVCAVVSGAAKCWGGNASGQLGNDSIAGSNAPVQVQGLTSGVTAVAAGGGFSCAIVSGAAKCWGSNLFGQLGNGSNSPSEVPVDVTGLSSGVTSISVSDRHACAVVSGVAKCWGDGDSIGSNLLESTTTPVNVYGTPDAVTDVETTDDHTCAVAAGELFCWGDPFAVGFGGYDYQPSQTVYRRSAFHVEFARDRACYVVSGTLKCFGDVPGYSPIISAASPVEPIDDGVEDVALGLGHICAVVDGEAVCWGANYSGQMGIGTETQEQRDGSYWPVSVPWLDSGVTDVTAGDAFSCAVVDQGAACWGDNSHGQLGTNDNESDGYPSGVLGLDENVSAVSAGATFACAIVDSAVKCWGANDHGQLGNGSQGESAQAVQVIGLTSGVSFIATHGNTACAIKSGVLYCWGENKDGLVGDDSTVDRSIPTQVASVTSGASSVSVAKRHACAVVSGSIKCWGNNIYGQLGDGKVRSTQSPVTVVGSAPGATDVSAGDDRTCGAINGSTRCWGYIGGNTQIFGVLKPVAERTAFEPETNFADGPDQLSTSGTAEFVLSSNDPDATFVCGSFLKGDAVEREAAFAISGFTAGSHEIACRAVDENGYADPVGAEYDWIVDQFPPTLMASSEYPAAGRLKITFSAIDHDIATATCAIDGGTPAPCESGYVTPELPTGTHTLVLSVADQAGNAVSRTFTFVVPGANNTDPTGPTSVPKPSLGESTYKSSTLRVSLRDLVPGSRVKVSLTFKDRGRQITAVTKTFSVGAKTKSVSLYVGTKAQRRIKRKPKGFSGLVTVRVADPSGGSTVLKAKVRLRS